MEVRIEKRHCFADLVPHHRLRGLLVGRFGVAEAAVHKLYWAVVIGFVLGDVRPLAVIVDKNPDPSFVRGHEPSAITIAKFGESALARLVYRSKSQR